MRDFVPFVDPRLHIKWIEGVGHGVFAKESIPVHTFVEISPAISFSPANLSGGELMNYVVSWGDRMAVGLGWTMVYNHSDENNCEFSMNYHDGLMAIISVREIRTGDQLTVNYGPEWFSSRNIDKRPL